MRVGRIRPEVVQALTRTTEVKRQVRTVANEIRRRARANAPVDTGNLRRKIWCHWLGPSDYRSVADSRDYTHD